MKNKVLMTASNWTHIRNFHLPYLRAFQAMGWETHLGCAGVPADAPFVDRIIELPFEKKMSSPANFRAARMLRKAVKAERYSLIICHTSLAAFFTRLAVKGLRGRPRLVNVDHGYLFDDETSALRRSVLLTAERVTAPETDLLLTMNRYDGALAERYRLGKRIETIPGIGVDFTRLDAAAEGEDVRAELGVAPDAFLLVYAAEFSARKSQRVVIEAMRLLPENAVLALPGSGALLEECRALADCPELRGRVLFPGYISDMAPWYRAADASVTSSRSEGLPFNVMEAMYCALPVVASAVKGHEDLIEDGVTGLLYPYGDAAACAAQIRRLMQSASLCEALGTHAKARMGQYDLEKVLPEVMARYLSQTAPERRPVRNK